MVKVIPSPAWRPARNFADGHTRRIRALVSPYARTAAGKHTGAGPFTKLLLYPSTFVAQVRRERVAASTVMAATREITAALGDCALTMDTSDGLDRDCVA